MRRRRLRISAEVMAHFLPPLQRMLIPYAASGLSVAISVAMPAPWTEKKLADSNPDPLFMTLRLWAGGGRGGFKEEGAWSADGGGGGVERRWRLSTNQARACLLYLKKFEDIFSRGKGPVPHLSFLPEQ